MSKYSELWNYVASSKESTLKLSFDEIGEIAGIPLDHSFLQFKKELLLLGWKVGKISMKEQTVLFEKMLT